VEPTGETVAKAIGLDHPYRQWMRSIMRLHAARFPKSQP
jgi:hypothetical protein